MIKFFAISLLTLFLHGLPGALAGQATAFLERHAHPIELSDTTDYDDLQVLDTLLQDKRFVLLGEFTHGAREINLLKNRLIRYLHAELGYGVLLLESGAGEVAVMNLHKKTWTPAQLLRAGLTGPWRTAEYEELLRYVRQSDLALAGFDPQRTGPAFAPHLEAVLLPVDSSLAALATQAETTFGSLTGRMRKNEFSTLMMQEKLNLVKRYESLLLGLEKYDRRLEKAGTDRRQQALLRRTLQNRIAFLDYFLQFKMDTDYRKRWAARDSLMAANIAWLAETVFPGEKFIVSAHNFHVAKANARERVMGELLSEAFGDQLYSIGLFARRGQYADNAGQPREMAAPAGEQDIKSVIARLEATPALLPIPAGRRPGDDWLHQPVIVNDSFLDLEEGNTLVPARAFDALLLLDRVSPPEK